MIEIGDSLRFVNPWGKKDVVSGEVVDVNKNFIAVDYEDSIVELYPISNSDGTYEIFNYPNGSKIVYSK